MKRIIAIVVAVVLMLVMVPSTVSAAAIRVESGDSIQDAIDAANPGDVIFVGPGTYNENVIVDKSVSIKGAGADVTTVQAQDSSKAVFAVVASGVRISRFTIKGANGHLNATGVLIGGLFPGDMGNLGVSGVKVSQNIVENNGQGIYIWHSSGNTIVKNVVRYNSSAPANVDAGNGIIVWDDGGGQDINNLIKNNDVYYNYKFGIFVGGAANMNADGTEINGNKLYRNGAYGGDANWLGMGFMNAMGTISVGGNNVFPTASGLDYWVWNSPGLVLDGTPSYGGIPVPPAAP